MREAFLIARREYLERVRTRAFLLTTFLMPAILIAIMGGSIFASMNGGGGGQHIVIASANAQLAEAVAQELKTQQKHPPLTEVQAPVTPDVRDALIRAVDDKRIDGALWLGQAPQSAGSSGNLDPEYLSRSTADIATTQQMERAVTSAVMRERLRHEGLAAGTIDASLKPVEVTTLKVKNGRASASSSIGSYLSAYIMVFLLYFTVIYYCMNVARSVIEEKTSRIFEVLLATTTPESLLGGKILGVGAAGLTQIGIWVAAALLLTGSSMMVNAGHTGAGLAALGITAPQVILLVVYFLLGFLFYSALSAALGASVSSEQEVQQFSFFISLPLLLCFISMNYVVSHPNAPAVVACSFFPPFTPMLMYLRVVAQQPPLWQIALSILLMAAAIYAMLWIASRIYRVGILMYGKRATLPEMLRWMRYS